VAGAAVQQVPRFRATRATFADDRWQPEAFLPRLLRVLEGNADEKQSLFRDVHDVALRHGFADVFESWQPDVRWLRGEEEYRQ